MAKRNILPKSRMHLKPKDDKKPYVQEKAKKHFKRKCKEPKPTHIAQKLKPGQIVIILSGRFRGRRVVYLKNLKSNLLLVTGPYKFNGVPLKRVNSAYCLPTNTFVEIDNKCADKVDDELFKRVEIHRAKEADFFEDGKTKKERIKKERKSKKTL